MLVESQCRYKILPRSPFMTTNQRPTEEERTEYFQLLARIELGGNDGADIFEFTEYARMLEMKYGMPVEHLMGTSE